MKKICMAWFSPPCIYSYPACNHALSLSHTNHCTCDGGRSPETTGVIPRKENRNKKRERTGSKSNRHGCTCTGCMMVQAYRAPNFIGALFSSMLYCTVWSYRPQSGNSLLQGRSCSQPPGSADPTTNGKSPLNHCCLYQMTP